LVGIFGDKKKKKKQAEEKSRKKRESTMKNQRVNPLRRNFQDLQTKR
jgi:hypothetical protein